MRKTIFLLALAALIGSSTAFPVQIDALNRTNNLENPARYELKVKNTFDSERTFKPSLKNTTRTWWFYEQNFKKLGAEESEIFEITVNASREAPEGRHNFTVEVRTLQEEKNSTSEYFILKKPDLQPEPDPNTTITNQSDEETEEDEKEEKMESLSIEKKYTENIFSRSQIITVSNPNDQSIKETVERSVPIYLSPLTFNSPAPDETRIADTRKVVEWNLKVPANGERTVRSSINHLLFFGGIGAILLGLVGIKLLKKSIKIEKEVKKNDEELKTIIHLKNHTNKEHSNLSVKDFVPSVLEVKEFKAGKPTVTKTDNGTRLEWEIEEVQPGEDRKLIYNMKPEFEEKSEVHLPEAELVTQEGEIKESSQKTFEIEPDT